MAKQARKYKVKFWQDEDGVWIARVLGVRGVHSYGRTIEQARARARVALSLAIGDKAARTAQFEDDIELEEAARHLIAKYSEATSRAAAQQKEAQKAALAAARTLCRRMSLRDAGAILGMSRQRISQILASE